MVVIREEVDRPPSVGHGVGYIAQNQGMPGAVHGDRAGETTKFRFVDDNHSGRTGVRPHSNVCLIGRRIQPLFGVP
jgi:hypothetical protein